MHIVVRGSSWGRPCRLLQSCTPAPDTWPAPAAEAGQWWWVARHPRPSGSYCGSVYVRIGRLHPAPAASSQQPAASSQQPAARHMPHGPSPAHPSPPPTHPPSPAQPTLTAWSSGCMFLMCFCRPKRKACQADRKASLMQLASSAAYWSRWGHSSRWHTRSTSSTDPAQQAQQAQQTHQAQQVQQMRHELRRTCASMAASAMGWAAPGTQAGRGSDSLLTTNSRDS